MTTNSLIPTQTKPLKFAILGVMVILIVAQAFLFCTQLSRQYYADIENEEKILGSIAKIADATISGTMKAIDVILGGVVAEVEKHGLGNSEDIVRYMSIRAEAYSDIKSLFVADSHGVIRLSVGTVKPGLDISDRDYFVRLKNSKHSDVGALIDYGISRIDGKPVLFIARSLFDNNHLWHGIAGASIDLKLFHSLLASVLPSGSGSAVFLVNKAGNILSRSPEPDKYLWASMNKDGSHYNSHIASGQQMSCRRIVYITDNSDRYSCARSLVGGQFYFFASRTMDEVLGAWRHDATNQTIGFVIWVIVIVVLSAILIRRQSYIEKVSEQLLLLSVRDGLTGVFNRRHFDSVFETELRRSQRTGVPLSLVMADVDFFKKYNDQYGHQMGDECLKAVSVSLQNAAARAGEVVARYGGEEFCVILPATTSDCAIDIAERMRAAVEKCNIPHDGSSIGHITISIGVTSLNGRLDFTSEQIIREADRALYTAKSHGRNVVVHYQDYSEK